jgi:DNA polymerase
VGKAGQLLTKMIGAMQFARSEVYIANIVKCRPPGNRNPEPDEVEACLPYLQRQIECVKPEVIVLLGAVPLRALLGGRSIRRERGQWRDFHGIPVMPTFHPSYLLRLPEAKREAWADLQQVMHRLGIDPQATKSQ